jgi:hypothetical protein
MSRRRWAIDRERRNRLAALTAEQFPAQILRRIVVIDREQTVRETTIWTWDSIRSAKRKLLWALSAQPISATGGSALTKQSLRAPPLFERYGLGRINFL